MCASPISASEWEDSINCLWRMSRLPSQACCGWPDGRLRSENVLEHAVIQAVAWHLCARGHLARAEQVAARKAASAALAAWERVVAEIAGIDPQLVARAHAFHAGLANRHQSAYRAFARKQLSDQAACARLKTESLPAAIMAAEGDLNAAGLHLDGISLAWRAALPVRLPGLRAIELAAAGWLTAGGDVRRARDAAARAATVSGVLSAYPDDAPPHWPRRPTQEELLRFALAATRLPETIEAWSVVQEA